MSFIVKKPKLFDTITNFKDNILFSSYLSHASNATYKVLSSITFYFCLSKI